MNILFPSSFNIIEPNLNLDTIPLYAYKWTLNFTQMEKGSKVISLDATHTPHMQLGYAKYPYAIQVNGGFPTNCILLFYTKTDGYFSFHNKAIHKYEINLIDKDTSIDFLSTKKSEVFTIVIEEKLFYESFYNYFGQGLKSFLKTQFFQVKPNILNNFLNGIRNSIKNIQEIDEKKLIQEYKYIEKEILNHIFSSLDIVKSHKKIEKFEVSKIRDLLQKSLKEDINIRIISKELNISERQLHHSFKTVYGFTPKQYLQNLRLNAIRNEFLLNYKSKISEVAIKYHFLHMGHFSSEFKKMFGKTPSEVLKEAKNQKEVFLTN